MISPLEPDGRRVLSDVILNSATLSRQFPTARKLDDDWRRSQEKPDAIGPALETVHAASLTKILRADHVVILNGALHAPSTDASASSKAHSRPIRTTRNLVLAASLASAVLLFAGETATEGFLREIGAETARDGALGQRAKDFLLKGDKFIDSLLEGEPADKRSAVRALVNRLKEMDQPQTSGDARSKKP